VFPVRYGLYLCVPYGSHSKRLLFSPKQHEPVGFYNTDPEISVKKLIFENSPLIMQPTLRAPCLNPLLMPNLKPSPAHSPYLKDQRRILGTF
jgi:hypothetical protein